jgi:hypothetical protein
VRSLLGEVGELVDAAERALRDYHAACADNAALQIRGARFEAALGADDAAGVVDPDGSARLR